MMRPGARNASARSSWLGERPSLIQPPKPASPRSTRRRPHQLPTASATSAYTVAEARLTSVTVARDHARRPREREDRETDHHRRADRVGHQDADHRLAAHLGEQLTAGHAASMASACDDGVVDPPAMSEPSRPVFLYDFNSPYAYLAAARVDEVLPVKPRWQPIAFAFLLRAHDRSPWSFDERERRIGIAECERRAEAYGLPPMRWPPGWPIESYGLTSLRAAIIAANHGLLREFSRAAFARQLRARCRTRRAWTTCSPLPTRLRLTGRRSRTG